MTPQRANWFGYTGIAVALFGGELIAAGHWWTIVLAVVMVTGWAIALLVS